MMQRKTIKNKLLLRKILTLADIGKVKEEIIQLQWESFFQSIQIMNHYHQGLVTKREAEGFRMGKITYPRLLLREVKSDAKTTPPIKL